MPRSGFNDDQNNQRLNLALHRVDQAVVGDDGRFTMRGTPTVGKVTYEGANEGTWDGSRGRPYVCTDVGEDGSRFGDGVYSIVQFGEDPPINTVGLTQTGNLAPDIEASVGRSLYSTRTSTIEFGLMIYTARLVVTASGTAGTLMACTLTATSPLADILVNASDFIDVGGFSYVRSGVLATGRVLALGAALPAAPATFNFYRHDGAELGSVVTAAANDVLTFSIQFPYVCQ